jgi:hypothetical protein
MLKILNEVGGCADKCRNPLASHEGARIRIVRAVLGRRLFGSLAREALIDISHLDVLARDVLNLAGKLADLGAVLIGGLTRSTSRWPSVRLPHAPSSPSSAWQTVEDSTQRGSNCGAFSRHNTRYGTTNAHASSPTSPGSQAAPCTPSLHGHRQTMPRTESGWVQSAKQPLKDEVLPQAGHSVSICSVTP